MTYSINDYNYDLNNYNWSNTQNYIGNSGTTFSDWNNSGSLFGNIGNNSTDSSPSYFSLEDYKKKKKEEADKNLEAYNKKKAQIQLLKNGASKYTTIYTDEQSGTQVEVYADKDGNPLKFQVDSNGQIALDSKGKPIKDANGSVIPVSDLKSIKKAKKDLKNSKKEDGSATVSESAKEYTKKVPWYKRALRAAGNMLQGTFKMAKSLVGYDENGKWNPVKCIKNVAILAAGVALTAVCPAAGPVLLYAGLGLGAIQVGKGVYKACTAKTVEEIDNAWQDVGVGVATVVASRAGVKGMGKSVGVDTSGLKMFTNAGQLVKSQPKNIYTNGVKGSGKQFVANLKNLNPFKSKTKEDLNKARTEHAQINSKLNDPTLSAAEQDALLNRGIQLEQEIKNLEAARITELCTSPTKWLSKKNREAIKASTGKNLAKSYWEANTAGKNGWGKTKFVAKTLLLDASMAATPSFLLFNKVSSGAYMPTFMGMDMYAYKQNYEEGGLLNSLIAPEAVQHISKEEYDNQLASLTQQEKAIKEQLASLENKNNTVA